MHDYHLFQILLQFQRHQYSPPEKEIPIPAPAALHHLFDRRAVILMAGLFKTVRDDDKRGYAPVRLSSLMYRCKLRIWLILPP